MGTVCGKGEIENQNFMTYLHQGDTKKIKGTIENKIQTEGQAFNINTPVNKMEDTLLHYAVYKQNGELVDFLLEKGADVNKKNSRQITPIGLCDFVKNEELKKKLQAKQQKKK